MKRKAQSTLEYAVFLGIIVAGLIGMQPYIKRGMQGRLKSSAEQLSEGATYAPGATNAINTVTREMEERSSSNTICRDDMGNEVNCNDKSVPKKLTKIRVSDSKVTVNQTTERLELTLPLADEPKRW